MRNRFLGSLVFLPLVAAACVSQSDREASAADEVVSATDSCTRLREGLRVERGVQREDLLERDARLLRDAGRRVGEPGRTEAERVTHALGVTLVPALEGAHFDRGAVGPRRVAVRPVPSRSSTR